MEPMLISIKRLLGKLKRAALKRILKEAGRKAHSPNFKHMHIADSRHKGRRVAIMSSNGHEKTKKRVNLKNCEFQKGQ